MVGVFGDLPIQAFFLGELLDEVSAFVYQRRMLSTTYGLGVLLCRMPRVTFFSISYLLLALRLLLPREWCSLLLLLVVIVALKG